VINFRVCGIAAGIAFILSLIIGIFSGTGFFVLLLRALLFAGVFFALAGLGFWIVSRFLPELMNEGEDDYDLAVPGSRVDISVGSSIEGAFPDDGSEAVDDIAGRPSAVKRQVYTPLDQNADSGYNEERAFDGDGSGGFSGLEPPESSDTGQAALPDMDNLSEEDSPGVQEAEVDLFTSGAPEPRRSSSSKKPTMADDFDAKDLARAIQTVLKKDEKG